MGSYAVSPLRRAVLTCLSYETPWTAETLRELAGVTTRATRMYLTRLRTREVVVEREDGTFTPGEQADAYKAERPKTKPGGNSKRYKAQKRALDDLAVGDWERRRRGGLTSEPAPPVQDCSQAIAMDATTTDSAMKMDDAAERLAVSRWTIKRWIIAGKLKGYRLPNGEYRASRAAVEEVFKQGVTDGSQ